MIVVYNLLFVANHRHRSSLQFIMCGHNRAIGICVLGLLMQDWMQFDQNGAEKDLDSTKDQASPLKLLFITLLDFSSPHSISNNDRLGN